VPHSSRQGLVRQKYLVRFLTPAVNGLGCQRTGLSTGGPVTGKQNAVDPESC